ncbi:MAG: lipase [Granulosicoccus sp.]|nr:lipase [Granulosicoccus sp.]
MKPYITVIALPVLALLVSCSDSNYDFDENKANLDEQIIAQSAPQALFNPDPAAPVLPFPNSLFFQGSLDGTLNLPVAEDADQTLANPRVALNQADGFSTVAPIVTAISEPLDAASLRLGDTIRVYEVETAQGIAVTGVVEEITNPLLIATRSIDSQLVLLPTVPLKPSTDYLVVLTDGLTDVDGNALTASLVYGVLKEEQELTNPSLEALRGATRSHLGAVQASSGIEPANVVLSWVFRTQSIREVLQATRDQSSVSSLALADSTNTTASEGIGLRGTADIYIGTLEVPYYQVAVGEGEDPQTALNSFWQNSGGDVVGALNDSGVPDYAPVATGNEVIPVLMTVPNTSAAGGGVMPADGWPVTIFQHGITRNRTDMLAIADAKADEGRVVIAIDMPLHGLTDNTNPFHADNTPFPERERTFDIDLAVNPPAEGEVVDADAPTSGADGKPDGSGQYFYNLLNLANSRDNLRQAVADLFVLTASLPAAQGEGFTLNAGNLTFVGHSLGGIVGSTMLSFDNSFQAATLAMPGGGIAQLLANSDSFGPEINDGLAAAGIATGSADYNTFLTVAQTLVDSGDPVNHASTLAQDTSTRLHLIQVIDDAVIPNFVSTAPLSGTDPLARLLGLPQIVDTSTTGGMVKFSAGDHGSIIDPTASLASTVEMQNQMAKFAATQGAELPISDSTVIQPLPQE